MNKFLYELGWFCRYYHIYVQLKLLIYYVPPFLLNKQSITYNNQHSLISLCGGCISLALRLKVSSELSDNFLFLP